MIGDGGGGAGGGHSNSNSVVSLVQQLKAGKMTKEELFDQLSKIQKAKRSASGDTSGRDRQSQHTEAARGPEVLQSPDDAGNYGTHGVDVALRMRDEAASLRVRDEKELIRLAKMKYGSHQHASSPSQRGGEGGRGTHNYGSAMDLQQTEENFGITATPSMDDDDFDRHQDGSVDFDRVGSGMDVEDIQEQKTRKLRQKHEQAQHRGTAWGTPQHHSAKTIPARPHSAEPARRQTIGDGCARTRPQSPGPWAGNAGSAPRGTPNGSGRQISRTRDFEFATAKRGADHRAIDRMRQIEKERQAAYTFRPNIQRGSGPDYVKAVPAGGTDLYERQLAWAKRRAEKMEEQRTQIQQEQDKECTFHPLVHSVVDSELYPFSNHTRKDAFSLDKHVGGGIGGDTRSETLSGSYSNTTAVRREPPVVDAKAVTDRLYQHGLDHKRHLHEKLRERLQEEMQRICTFKPDVKPEGKVRDPTPVRSRYMDNTPRKNESAVHSVIMQEERELLECTFKPAVRSPTKNMHVAREYLSEPAWLRLSRPRPVTPQASNENMSTNAQNRGPSPAMAHSKAAHRAPSPARTSKSVESECTSGSNFDNFLERQENFVRKMEYNLERRLQEEEAAKRGPQLCDRSMKILARKAKEEGGRVPFLQRIQMSLEKKEDSKKAITAEIEDALTFQPAINKASRELRGRSWQELSIGDSLHRTKACEDLKKVAESVNTQVYTFKPKLNHVAGVQSRLKVASDPDNYLSRIEHEQRMAQRYQIKTAQEMMEQELRECTFQPRINDAPAYIKKIADSQKRKKQALQGQAEDTRQQRANSSENVCAEWNNSVSIPTSSRKASFAKSYTSMR